MWPAASIRDYFEGVFAVGESHVRLESAGGAGFEHRVVEATLEAGDVAGAEGIAFVMKNPAAVNDVSMSCQ